MRNKDQKRVRKKCEGYPWEGRGGEFGYPSGKLVDLKEISSLVSSRLNLMALCYLR
jgi:hypothetical protein